MAYRDWTIERKHAHAEQVRERNRNRVCDCAACQREQQAEEIARVTRLTENWRSAA